MSEVYAMCTEYVFNMAMQLYVPRGQSLARVHLLCHALLPVVLPLGMGLYC